MKPSYPHNSSLRKSIGRIYCYFHGLVRITNYLNKNNVREVSRFYSTSLQELWWSHPDVQTSGVSKLKWCSLLDANILWLSHWKLFLLNRNTKSTLMHFNFQVPNKSLWSRQPPHVQVSLVTVRSRGGIFLLQVHTTTGRRLHPIIGRKTSCWWSFNNKTELTWKPDHSEQKSKK